MVQRGKVPAEGHRARSPAVQTAGIVLLAFTLLIVGTNLHLSAQSPREEGHGFLNLEGGRHVMPQNHDATPVATLSAAKRLQSTLVVYVYSAKDAEEERNFAFFLRYGITGESSPTYRIIITHGHGVINFPRLPTLPPNAEYIHTHSCSNTWGAIGAVINELPLAQYGYYMVVDSSVRGPFLPPYVTSYAPSSGFHWTDAFTSKIKEKVKLVGSTISCEGAPLSGNAAGQWRGNPAVSAHVWATDSAGWSILTADADVFKCHESVWDLRYFSDVGASLAVLREGFTLDCLLARYQGIDWAAAASWQCNQRVPPDYEWHYDGISITPYETIFVPMSEASVEAGWSFVAAAQRYETWADGGLRPRETRPGVQTNQWIAKNWAIKTEKLVYMNTRGPECFDFDAYVRLNPDLGGIASNELDLWEHFLLIGQFQARRHRFTCGMPVGNSFRVAYVLARGPRCFDHRHYLEQHRDLQDAGFTTANDLFGHFLEFGQFEQRRIRFTCADTMTGLPAGFDSLMEEALDEDFESREANEERAALLKGGNANDPVQQALKGALVAEVAKQFTMTVER